MQLVRNIFGRKCIFVKSIPDDVDDDEGVDEDDEDHGDGQHPDAVASVHPATGSGFSI
jgi:hypothetical protein